MGGGREGVKEALQKTRELMQTTSNAWFSVKQATEPDTIVKWSGGSLPISIKEARTGKSVQSRKASDKSKVPSNKDERARQNLMRSRSG